MTTTDSFADSVNYGKTWETDGGVQVHGRVQFKATHPAGQTGALHVKQGYQRFTRQADPPLDTGRMYTYAASSPSDPGTYAREDQVTDSLLTGDKYTTHYNYGFDYFSGDSCFGKKAATSSHGPNPNNVAPC